MTAKTSESAAGLTIQQMARQSGLSEHTLRYYERIGLLTHIDRQDSSGHRRYSPETAALVENLMCLRGVGMPLAEMRRYLQLRERGVEAAGEQKELFAAQVASVEREIEVMKTRLAYLQGKVAYWDAVESGEMDRARSIGERNQALVSALVPNKEKR